jgi:hypothetical protein
MTLRILPAPGKRTISHEPGRWTNTPPLIRQDTPVDAVRMNVVANTGQRLRRLKLPPSLRMPKTSTLQVPNKGIKNILFTRKSDILLASAAPTTSARLSPHFISRPGRPCETCRHPERHAIDLAIIAGQSKRDIAQRFGLSPSSVQRHRDNCVPNDLVQAQLSRNIDRADYLLARSCALELEAKAIGEEARNSHKPGVALNAIGEQRRILAMQSGQLVPKHDSNSKNSTQSDLEQLKKEIIDALRPYEEARAAVAKAIDSSRYGT